MKTATLGLSGKKIILLADSATKALDDLKKICCLISSSILQAFTVRFTVCVIAMPDSSNWFFFHSKRLCPQILTFFRRPRF